jgi:hypothetical protein
MKKVAFFHVYAEKKATFDHARGKRRAIKNE